MKNRFFSALACLALLSGTVVAQTQYEAARVSGLELNGTARFVGMGGAMGALGADISTIGSNPAGIGMYRSHELSTSLSWNSFSADTQSYESHKNRMSFDQLGFVYAFKVGNETDLRFVNFAFNYHKSKNFTRQLAAGGSLNGLSQTQQMANMVNHLSVGNIDDVYNYGDYDDIPNPYNNYSYPYLGVMGIRTELVGIDANDKPIGWNGISNGYFSREKGGIDSYDMNLSINVQDRYYFGLTLGIDGINYRKDSYYTEDIVDGAHSGYYELDNYYKLEGVGVDLKLGAIIRPIEDSPFRIGAAIHTPKWYELTEKYTAQVGSELDYDGGLEHFSARESLEDYVNGVNLRDYTMTTPWKFQLSAGTTVENMIALGAEYEYMDYSTARMRYKGGDKIREQNANVREDLRGVHTVRVGMEARLAPEFSVRAGYNFSTAAFKKGAYKALDYNDMRTDVDYENSFEKHTISAGLGYRGENFFADLTYKYNTYKSDFYPFSADALRAANVDNSRHQVLLTLGVRF